MLHASDKSPVKYERVCLKDGKPVAWEDLVKGYEYEKGRFIVLTREDLKAAAANRDKTIHILDFVQADTIDDRYFETPYYLLPDKSGQHAYALLRETLKETGRVGIAKVVIRDAQHLASVEVIDDALVLTMLRYADELVDDSGLRFPSSEKVRKQELDMARMLVDHLASDWNPEKYTDDYRENLLKVINARIKGQRPKLPPAEDAPQGEVIDLMERLRRSLESGGKGASKAGRTAKRTRRKKSKPAHAA
jgi:DNA end-binding protein Ku